MAEAPGHTFLRELVLGIVVFVSGAAVMIFELTGSRVLAPYLGTSIFVWASLIGIVLGSLSLGYWLGGSISDRRPDDRTLSLVIFLAAAGIAAMTLVHVNVLDLLNESGLDIRSRALVACIALVTVPSVLLEMVSPFAVRLKMKGLATSGRTVGNLYALSTVGSIAGTFLAGFVLIPFFGTTKILYFLSALLALTAALPALRRRLLASTILIAAAVVLAINEPHGDVIVVETQYNSVRIADLRHESGRPMRVMAINRQASSAMFLDGDDLVHDYTRFFRLAGFFRPDPRKTLMLGGAAYSYPKAFLRENPGATMDVVEIDPTLTRLAAEHFDLDPAHPRLRIIHEDARIFLNETDEVYDVVYGDVFNSIFSIPFHLTTRECVQRIYDILDDGGVAVMNLVSAIDGTKGKFLRAEYATYESVFPQVYLFAVDEPVAGEETQNIMILAIKSSAPPAFRSDRTDVNRQLENLWKRDVARDVPVLTDEHAPVDYYLSQAM